MSIISNIFKTKSNEPIVYTTTLESKDTVTSKSPIGKLIESPKRVKKSDLKLCYLRDDVCYNGINIKSELTITPKISFRCYDGENNRVASDEAFLEFWRDKINLRDVLVEVVKNANIGGVGWIENLRSIEDKTTLVDQRSIDMTKIDYLRDVDKNIVFKKDGITPLSAVQVVDYTTEVPRNRDPSIVYKNMNMTFYVPAGGKYLLLFDEEIFPIVLNDDEIGIIEPQYDIIRQKISTMRMAERTQRKRANVRYLIRLGNQDYMPGPTEREKIRTEFSNLNADEDIVVDWFVDVEEMGKNINDTSIQREDTYVIRQCTCMGVPSTYVTGVSQGENESIVADLKSILFTSIESMQKKIGEQYLRNTIPLLNHDFTSVRQEIEWGHLTLESMESKSLRIQRYTKAGVIEPDDILEAHVRETEFLPKKDDATKRRVTKPVIKEEPVNKKEKKEEKEEEEEKDE